MDIQQYQEWWGNRWKKAREHIEQVEKETEQGGMLVVPGGDINPVSPFFVPVISELELSGDRTYYAKKQKRLSFKGCLAIATAAGMEWDPVNSGRVDDRKNPLYVAYSAVGGVRHHDGSFRAFCAPYDMDLAVIKKQLEEQYPDAKDKWKIARDYAQKERYRLMLCDSGAKARVIKAALDLASNIGKAEWVVVVKFVVCHLHPEIQKQMAANLAGNIGSAFGHGAPPVSPVPAAVPASPPTIPVTPPQDPGADIPPDKMMDDFLGMEDLEGAEGDELRRNENGFAPPPPEEQDRRPSKTPPKARRSAASPPTAPSQGKTRAGNGGPGAKYARHTVNQLKNMVAGMARKKGQKIPDRLTAKGDIPRDELVGMLIDLENME